MVRRRTLAGAVTLLATVFMAGCASIPSKSDIKEAGAAVGEAPDLAVGVYALPPELDATPQQIVQGFMEAAGAVNFEVAADYLAPDIEWSPSTVVVYTDSNFSHIPNPDEDIGQVRFTADKIAELDEQHAFTPASGDPDLDEVFTLTQVDGQWRISEAPDELFISEIDFELQYESYNRYYFDPSQTVLVPDPIYLREADQDLLAARLVSSLLGGPTDWLAPGVMPVIPSGTQCASDPEACSSDVSIEGGVATVRLSTNGEGLDAERRGHLLAQVVWTLNELDVVDEVVVVVDGLPISGQRRNIEAFSEVRPAGSGQSTPVRRAYLLIDGRLQTQALDPRQTPTPVAGPFSAADAPRLVAFAVASKANEIAVVTEEMNAYVFEEGASARPEPILSGARLLSPSWDRFGRLWMVDAADGESVVHVWDGKGDVREVEVPDLDGAIEQFAVSDDGTRMALVVADEAGERHAEVRVVHWAGGGVELANPRPLAPDIAASIDVAWQNADTLVVLGSQSGPAADADPANESGPPAQPYLVSIDSSIVDPQGIAAEDSVSVAAAPNLPILVGTEQSRVFQNADGVWTDIGEGAGPGYAG